MPRAAPATMAGAATAAATAPATVTPAGGAGAAGVAEAPETTGPSAGAAAFAAARKCAQGGPQGVACVAKFDIAFTAYDEASSALAAAHAIVRDTLAAAAASQAKYAKPGRKSPAVLVARAAETAKEGADLVAATAAVTAETSRVEAARAAFVTAQEEMIAFAATMGASPGGSRQQQQQHQQQQQQQQQQQPRGTTPNFGAFDGAGGAAGAAAPDEDGRGDVTLVTSSPRHPRTLKELFAQTTAPTDGASAMTSAIHALASGGVGFGASRTVKLAAGVISLTGGHNGDDSAAFWLDAYQALSTVVEYMAAHKGPRSWLELAFDTSDGCDGLLLACPGRVGFNSLLSDIVARVASQTESACSVPPGTMGIATSAEGTVVVSAPAANATAFMFHQSWVGVEAYLGPYGQFASQVDPTGHTREKIRALQRLLHAVASTYVRSFTTINSYPPAKALATAAGITARLVQGGEAIAMPPGKGVASRSLKALGDLGASLPPRAVTARVAGAGGAGGEPAGAKKVCWTCNQHGHVQSVCPQKAGGGGNTQGIKRAHNMMGGGGGAGSASAIIPAATASGPTAAGVPWMSRSANTRYKRKESECMWHGPAAKHDITACREREKFDAYVQQHGCNVPEMGKTWLEANPGEPY